MRRRRMVGWMISIPVLVVVLIVIIILHEPEPEGISRAAAYKAAALSVTTVGECMESSEEKSYFSASCQKQWYVKYMDELYNRGWISAEMTPPDEKTAEGMLTYGDAAYLAQQVSDTLKKQVGLTKKNSEKPFPAQQWWSLYESLCQAVETDSENPRVTEKELLIYALPEDVQTLSGWQVYTDHGTLGFEGLGLSRYRDTQISVLVSGNEIVRIIGQVSESVVYKNVWITDAQEKQLTGYVGSVIRQLEVKKKIKEPESMVSQVADLYLEKGEIKKVVLKKERIGGKVLEVREDSIEIEGYGSVPMDDNFSVYQLYGDFRRQSLSEILVGYDVHEFVVADGHLCAALTMRPADAETIRVLIMDTGFKSIFHDTITLEMACSGVMIKGEEEKAFCSGDTISFVSGDPQLGDQRIILKPDDETGQISVLDITRSQGTPAYPGRLEVKQEAEGLVLVNELYLEDYLKRVVPSEMPASYEKEALKAQAVCARTYAYRQIRSNSYKQYGAHVDDSTRYQVYNNIETGTSSDMAVNETYGKMLMYGDSVAEAYYFSTSCGHTTDGTIWGASPSSLPYLCGVAVREGGGVLDLTDNAAFSQFIKSCPAGYESKYAMYRWRTKLTSSQLEQKVSDIGTITSVTMTERSTGGIGKTLNIQGTAGSKTIRGEGQIRSILGNTDLVIEKNDGNTVTGWSSLPSAFIAIECSSQDENQVTTFTIYGGGFGHGVGMSQNGAQGMAKAGKNYREILEFFYHGTSVAEISQQ